MGLLSTGVLLPPRLSMQRWQYRSDTVATPNLDEHLQLAGADGWELVTAHRTRETIHVVRDGSVDVQLVDAFDLIFKRPGDVDAS